MKKSTIITISVVAIIFIMLFWLISSYNGMVTVREDADQQWAEVENQYQRRFDLIPNLVETVKGYAKHESETFEKVTAMRAGLSDAYNKAEEAKSSDPSNTEYNDAQKQLNRALNLYINAVHEAYPDLKANQNFNKLQDELAGTENRVTTARNRYIKAVRDYNLRVKRFPGNIIAGMFGFEELPQFNSTEGAATAPKVNF